VSKKAKVVKWIIIVPTCAVAAGLLVMAVEDKDSDNPVVQAAGFVGGIILSYTVYDKTRTHFSNLVDRVIDRRQNRKAKKDSKK
jgi:glutamate 5-kinase